MMLQDIVVIVETLANDKWMQAPAYCETHMRKARAD